ncbi:MAG: hypothetical protein U9Q92_04080, partial [archaeon]|nr:hypothetical protein [archaeon]
QINPKSDYDAVVREIDQCVRNILDGHISQNSIIDVNTSGEFTLGGSGVDNGVSNTKSIDPVVLVGGQSAGKTTNKIEPIITAQSYLFARGLLNHENYKDRTECYVKLHSQIGRERPKYIEVMFDDSNTHDEKAVIILQEELPELLDIKHIIDTYLPHKKETYELIRDYGVLGAVFEECRPPFEI